MDAGVYRNPVRDICRMLWSSLGGKSNENILNEGSHFGFDWLIIKGI
jgi:hypothetical protein